MNFIKKFFTSQKEEVVVNVTTERVIQEMNDWVQVMQKKVPRVSKSIFFNSDNEDEFLLNLKPIHGQLGGRPSKQYYMSRITQEVFEEDDKHLALLLDSMQVIVEHYVAKRKKYPIKAVSEENEIEYSYLIGAGLLNEAPKYPLYIEEFEYGYFFVTSEPQRIKKILS